MFSLDFGSNLMSSHGEYFVAAGALINDYLSLKIVFLRVGVLKSD